MDTRVYIDAFNFYYGCTRGTPYRWCDLSALCKLLTPQCNVDKIKLFYAISKAFPEDPSQPQRQQVYLRALQTIPNIEFIAGNFVVRERWKRLVTPLPDGTKSVKVLIAEEKGSDVNLATHLLHDGFQGLYDCAVVVSNDSDLLEPVRIVSQVLGKQLIILNPHKQPTQLSQYANLTVQIRERALKRCQFPNTMTDAQGTFSRPTEWY